jgi:hypothetical protein
MMKKRSLKIPRRKNRKKKKSLKMKIGKTKKRNGTPKKRNSIGMFMRTPSLNGNLSSPLPSNPLLSRHYPKSLSQFNNSQLLSNPSLFLSSLLLELNIKKNKGKSALLAKIKIRSSNPSPE